MFFNVLLLMIVLIVVVALILTFVLWKEHADPGDYIGLWLLSGIIAMFPLAIIGSEWGIHAGDLAIVDEQHRVIAVQAARIERLTKTLQTYDHSVIAPFLLNADHPIASVVKSLSDAEEALTSAQVVGAEAIVRITARRHGPMSGVIRWVGDIDESVALQPETK